MKPISPPIPQGRAAQRWRPLVEALRASGVSVRAFAAQRGLCAASLYVWRRRLRAEPILATSPTSSPPRLVPITLMPPTLCELVLRSGRVLRFDPSLDPETLLRLVRAAESP